MARLQYNVNIQMCIPFQRIQYGWLTITPMDGFLDFFLVLILSDREKGLSADPGQKLCFLNLPF